MLPTRSALEHKIHELLNYKDNEKIVWIGVPGPLWAPRKTNKISFVFVLPVMVYAFVWMVQMVSDPKFSMFPDW